MTLIYKNEKKSVHALSPGDTETVQFTSNPGLTSKVILLFIFQLKNNQLVQKGELEN